MKKLYVSSLFSAFALWTLRSLSAGQTQDLPLDGWKLWLDQKAEWKNDELFLPPADLSKLPIHEPTGGWAQLFSKSLPENQAARVVADPTLSLDVQVPGTVEEFCWDALSGKNGGLGTSGNYVGVSWWGRDFTVPAAAKGKRVKLFFSEGIRQRAEVFVNQKLVGYELVHQTPFEIDVTDAVQFGSPNKLAVRITDPNGNFSWGDYTGLEWGKYYFPLSHGFGGILGTVVVKVVDPVHVADIFVKNKPTLTDVDVDVEIANDGQAPLSGTFSAEIVEAWQHGAPVAKPQTVFQKDAGSFQAAPGQTTKVSLAAAVPQAKLWAIRDGNLYNLVITLKDAQGKVLDQSTQRFGFRFLSVEGYGTNARLYLNGKRTFLLSAISWGFWPINGIFPTPELARRHVQSALALGQNMLNFHRCQGNTLVLNTADELGMLYYEEPGSYSSSRFKADNPAVKKVSEFDLAMQLNSQRLLRMVKRDPTLISQYMRPLYVAVKARDKVGDVGGTNLVDFFVINEHAIPAGEYTVKAAVQNPAGAVVPIFSGKVRVSAGDKFSDLVTQQVPVPLNAGIGYYRIRAELFDAAGKKIADGHDEIFAVDWKSDRIGGKGAVLGGSRELLGFARDIKKANVVPYSDNLGRLDYVVFGPTDQGSTFQKISPFNTRTTDGKTIGLNLDYFRGQKFGNQVDKRISTASIDFDSKSKFIPGYDILGETDFSVRWQGFLVSEVSGPTEFELSFDDGARIWFDGKLVIDAWTNGPTRKVNFSTNLQAGKPYPIKIEAYQAGGGWEFALKWKQPIPPVTVDFTKLLKRVKEDGTKLLLVEGAEQRIEELKKLGAFPAGKVFHPAKTWVGSNFFVRQHPFFADLPVNGGMNWEYQRLVVYDGPTHFGLYDMQGEEAVVSLVGGVSHLVSTSVGIVPYGKGQIAFSSLDLAPNLALDLKAASVPKKIFCNYLKWASGTK